MLVLLRPIPSLSSSTNYKYLTKDHPFRPIEMTKHPGVREREAISLKIRKRFKRVVPGDISFLNY